MTAAAGDHDPAGAGTAAEGLRDHGDRQVPADTLDLAVNVRAGPPAWLRAVLAAAVADLRAYPDPGPARAALAERHRRPTDEVLELDGAAEGFWLLPALRPRLAACVHPEFTEGEAALRAAGVPVVRVHRRPEHGWRLPAEQVPAAADLVLLGRPGNPTGVVDAVETIAALCRPGRVVVVDEAFVDFLPEASGLAARRDLPGLVCLRSATKLWGLAGLRVGHLVGPAAVVARLAAARQPWSVSAPGLAALVALAGAEEERRARAAEVAAERTHLVAGLDALPWVGVHPSPANYVLLETPVSHLRRRLLDHGVAVRRCETFPGLDDRWVRVAVREPAVTDRLVAALTAVGP